jgi:triosephosphate isomerase
MIRQSKTLTQSKPKYVIANWKSNPSSLKELEQLQKGYISLRYSNDIRLVVCPSPIHQLLELYEPAYLGAQNVNISSNKTGLWSSEMLFGIGVSHCLVGHSEMRSIGESDIDVRNKVVQLIEIGLIPIVCVGETLRDDNGKYINIIRHQLKMVFDGLSSAQAQRIIIAYEPIWAIGSGAMRQCTSAECYEIVHIIREEISRLIPEVPATDVVVVYGGSVDAGNASSYISEGAADGLLIGRASLDAAQMKSILAQVDAL